MLKQLLDKRKARIEKINEARSGFTSWVDISKSKGWKVYEEAIEKKIENIKNRLETDMTLTGEDLKRLQLALAVYREVVRIPKDLEERAKEK